MDALNVLVTMFVLRLILPVGALLLLGEWMRNHQRPTNQRR